MKTLITVVASIAFCFCMIFAALLVMELLCWGTFKPWAAKGLLVSSVIATPLYGFLFFSRPRYREGFGTIDPATTFMVRGDAKVWKLLISFNQGRTFEEVDRTTDPEELEPVMRDLDRKGHLWILEDLQGEQHPEFQCEAYASFKVTPEVTELILSRDKPCSHECGCRGDATS